jgi:hypothetical protein
VKTGNFIRDNPYTMATLSAAVRFWSQGEMEALFLTHEGFAGCLGAYLCSTQFRLGMKGWIYEPGQSEAEGERRRRKREREEGMEDAFPASLS